MFFIAALAVLVGSLASAGVAHAQSLTVTTCTETGFDSVFSTAQSGDTIYFACSGTISLTSTHTVSNSLTIDGAAQNVTFDGGGKTQLFSVAAGQQLTLKNLTLSNGYTGKSGGAVIVNGHLSVSNVVFTGNSAAQVGGAISVAPAPGDTTDGALTVTNSTFTNNSSGGHGGAIDENGSISAAISSSTFSGNSSADGGAMAFGYGNPAKVINSTFYGNTASITGGAIYTYNSVSLSFSTLVGNGMAAATIPAVTIDNSSQVTPVLSVGNTILDNTLNCGISGPSTIGTFADAQGNVLYGESGGNSCKLGSTGNVLNGDPKVGPLANNSGPTQTIALSTGSAAIGLATNCNSVASDQRGQARPSTGCDSGAYETTPSQCPLQPSYSSFSDATCLQLNGNDVNTASTGYPVVTGGALQLVSGTTAASRAAYYKRPIDLTSSFGSQFNFTITPTAGTNGDGLTFIIQNDPRGASAIGCQGGMLAVGCDPTQSYPPVGFGGASTVPSVAVEFDTVQNPEFGEQSCQHVAVVVNSTFASERDSTCVTSLNNGQMQARVDYSPSSGLTVTLGSTTLFTDPSIDLQQIVGSQGYVGFGAGTGSYTSDVDIQNWTVGPYAAPAAAPAFNSGQDGAYTWGGTSTNKLVLSGTAPASSTVTLYGDGVCGASIGTTGADSSGKWSTTVSNIGTDGNTYKYSATDSASGGTSGCSSPLTVHADRTAPASAVTFPGLTPNTPYLNASGWTAGCGTGTTDDICGTASDNSSGVAAVFVAIENSNGKFWNGTDFTSSGAWVKATGTTSWNVALPRPSDGVYTVASAAIDNAGNTESIFGKSIDGICDVSGTGGQLSLNGGQLSINGGLCTVNGTGTNGPVSGQLSLNGGQLSLNGGQLSLNGGQLSLNSGQLSLNGGLCTLRDNTGASATYSLVQASATTPLALTSSGGQLSLNGGQLSINGGQLSINGGALSAGTGGQLSLNGGQLSINGGDCTVTTTGSTSGQLSLNGGQLSLNGGQLSLNGGQLSINGGQLSLNGGQLSLNGGQLSINGGAGASSSVGNVVVDTTAPTGSVTVDGQTADGSVNIDPASTVHVSFSETMASSSITATHVALSPSANAPTCGSDGLCQNVSITGLSSATTYTLTLSGATDLAGNPVAPLTFHFTTAATGPVKNVDTDGDGIPDAWDGGTIPLTGGRSLSTGPWGFTPTTKDLCLVESYMNGTAADGISYNQAITQNANQLIVNAFQRHGIHLVIFEGDAAHSAGLPSGYGGPYYGGSIPMVDPLGNTTNGSFDWTNGSGKNVAGFQALRASNFVPTGLAQICHYAVIAHRLGGTTSTGSSRGFAGSDFVVALAIGDGGVGSTLQQAGTVMHELGHNLGLHHGGAVSPSTTGRLPADIDTNHKPNYLSVMNYNYQFTGVLQTTASANNQPCTIGSQSLYCLLDYSTSALPPLNKSSLNEAAGVGAPSNYAIKHECPTTPGGSTYSNVVVLNGSGPIDWNCNSLIDPFLTSGVSANINADAGGASTLSGYDDWDNLNFLVGTIGLGADGTGSQGPEDTTSTIDVDPGEPGGIDIIGPETSSEVVPVKASITWPTPADITYGTALSGTQLNATANVPGTITYSPASGTVLNPGAGQVLTATWTPTDTADFATTMSTVTINVRYSAAGTTCNGDAGHQILQPVNTDGSSVFKQGSTVPLKFRVCDAAGHSVGPTSFASSVVSTFGLTKSVTGSGSVNETTVSTTADTAFRWDSTAQQWIYNLSTRSLTAGNTYTYTITLNDGSAIAVSFGLS